MGMKRRHIHAEQMSAVKNSAFKLFTKREIHRTVASSMNTMNPIAMNYTTNDLFVTKVLFIDIFSIPRLF